MKEFDNPCAACQNRTKACQCSCRTYISAKDKHAIEFQKEVDRMRDELALVELPHHAFKQWFPMKIIKGGYLAL